MRLVAPPPGKRGGQHWHVGRRHGYEATYQFGCRCDLCRAAHRQGAARRRAAKT